MRSRTMTLSVFAFLVLLVIIFAAQAVDRRPTDQSSFRGDFEQRLAWVARDLLRDIDPATLVSESADDWVVAGREDAIPAMAPGAYSTDSWIAFNNAGVPCFQCISPPPASGLALGIPFPERHLNRGASVEYGVTFKTSTYSGPLYIVFVTFVDGNLTFADFRYFAAVPSNSFGAAIFNNQVLPNVAGAGLAGVILLDGTGQILDAGAVHEYTAN